MTINTLLRKVNQNKKFNINTYDFFKPTFNVKLAESRGEIKLAQKLRYKVFFSERIKNPILNIGNFRRDSDKFDNYADHIIVTHRKSKFSKTRVIGTYRLLKQSVAEKKSGFYSCDEFNLDNLLNSGVWHFPREDDARNSGRPWGVLWQTVHTPRETQQKIRRVQSRGAAERQGRQLSAQAD